MDSIQSVLSAQEKLHIDQMVSDYNKTVNPGRQPSQSLGKDDFLKILITQLAHQDPMAPMEDREFIAQMAQFSTLEQMTGMAKDFSRLTAMVSGSEASSALGKNVELIQGEQMIQGVVKAVTRGEAPQVLVNGVFYDWDQVHKVFED
jgi:flagellar basal-body rod modification protein FlgD